MVFIAIIITFVIGSAVAVAIRGAVMVYDEIARQKAMPVIRVKR